MTQTYLRRIPKLARRFPVTMAVVIGLGIVMLLARAFPWLVQVPATPTSRPIHPETVVPAVSRTETPPITVAVRTTDIESTASAAHVSATAPLHSILPTARPPTAAPSLSAATAAAVAPLSPTPQATLPPIPQRTIAAQSALRDGQLTAVFDYANGTSVLTRMVFDLGPTPSADILHIDLTYRGSAGSQTIKRLMMGNEMWQIQDGGGWQHIEPGGTARDILAAFLPNVDRASREPAVVMIEGRTTLRWYDSAHDTDISVDVDPISGIPLRMQQRILSSGATLNVTYDGWNGALGAAGKRDDS